MYYQSEGARRYGPRGQAPICSFRCMPTAMTRASLRGASIYTLSDRASDAADRRTGEERKMAPTRSPGVDISDESEEVSSILIELTMRETMNQSARFARMLFRSSARSMPLLKNTHRFAGFRVFKAPDVPSVLVELGQLSNKSDEERLTDGKVEARMAERHR